VFTKQLSPDTHAALKTFVLVAFNALWTKKVGIEVPLVMDTGKLHEDNIV
jgi:hypothetical protein